MGRNAGEFYHGYTDEVYDKLLERIMMGRSLKSVCRDEDMPHYTGVYQKCRNDPEFAKSLAEAREWQCAGLTDDHLDLLPLLLSGDIDPKAVTAHMHSTKMIIEKMAPRAFGAKQSLDHQSSDGSMTPKPAVDMSKLSTTALAELLAAADDADRE